MSSYAEKLSLREGAKYPKNPCKFLRMLIRDGDWDKYAEVIDAMFLDYPLLDIAAILEEDLGFVVTKDDVWKHRQERCGGCRSTISESLSSGK